MTQKVQDFCREKQSWYRVRRVPRKPMVSDSWVTFPSLLLEKVDRVSPSTLEVSEVQDGSKPGIA
jgi:hypothetical protein